MPSTESSRNPRRAHAPVEAMLFMLLGVFGFSIADASVKWLTSGYGSWQILFVPRVLSLPLIFYLVYRATGGMFRVRTAHLKMHVLRCVLGIVTAYTFFEGLRYLPLADCISIAFASPLFMTAFSGPLLGERIGPRRWSAVLVGFAGVLVALTARREEGAGIAGFLSSGALLILISALAYALLLITLRPLSARESAANIMFYSTILSLGVSAVPALAEWVPPDPAEWGVFALVGAGATVAQMATIRAFRLGEASLLAPIEFTALIWAILFGWLFWSEWPTGQTLIGAGIIIAANLYIAHREAVLDRKGRRLAAVPEHPSMTE
jgi:drug/metabolite transporter (DMT)-like permease